MKVEYHTADSDDDLRGVLTLQVKNLARSLSANEKAEQGFVTVEHCFDLLKKLNNTEKHIVAKSNNIIVGYVLSMTKNARAEIPFLYPMFDVFDRTAYLDRSISEYNYIIVGQVCVDKDFRGQGIFDNCYKAYKDFHKDTYDFAITEIAQTNLRSLNAHKRIGFKELTSYTDSYNTTWIVVVWDWKISSREVYRDY